MRRTRSLPGLRLAPHLPAGWVVTVDEHQVLHVTRAEHAVDLPRDGGGGLLLVLVVLSTLLL